MDIPASCRVWSIGVNNYTPILIGESVILSSRIVSLGSSRAIVSGDEDWRRLLGLSGLSTNIPTLVGSVAENNNASEAERMTMMTSEVALCRSLRVIIHTHCLHRRHSLLK